jgi:N-acetylglutamate synthase-like GNAT family acetyltransferase
MVEELAVYSSRDLVDIDILMHELSATSYCDETLLYNILNDANTHVYVIRENGYIVATGTLCVKHTLEFSIADIESVVVSSKCRGRGYGKDLMNTMIDKAKQLSVHHIQLTSNPKRVAANQLYQDMGFERYDTNCYKMVLSK